MFFFVFCFFHLVVVFHNCGRNRLRVFGRSGLAIPWRFHVWRGGKIFFIGQRWKDEWLRKERITCVMGKENQSKMLNDLCVWTMMMISCVWGKENQSKMLNDLCVWRMMMMITCVWGRGYTMHGAWVGGRESSTACSLVPPTFHLQEIFLTDFLLLKDRPSSLYCQI